MKVKELIELLKDMPQDLEVYSYCDHGQTPEKSGVPSVAYTDNFEYLYEGNWLHEDEAEDYGYTLPFVLL